MRLLPTLIINRSVYTKISIVSLVTEPSAVFQFSEWDYTVGTPGEARGGGATVGGDQ